MRWAYKTVQYGLKKEGLLGSSFLDEGEFEQSLNEFGQAGWEMVSLLGMHDGIMAVFKQPLEMAVAPVPVSVTEEAVASPSLSLKSQEASDAECRADRKGGRREPSVSVVMEKEEEKEEENGVGAIRIE